MTMTALGISKLTKRYGRQPALDELDLSVAEGEFLVVLGRSGAGKTTLLKLIAGLLPVDSGVIRIDGQDVAGLGPESRSVSLQFQNLALFPDRSAFENLAFPLLQARMGMTDVRRRVGDVADLLRIGHLLDRRPDSFSGGEAQRVAIGRAIVHPTRLLLLDEPLSNLDARLRLDLRIEFRRLHRELGRTIVYVTHDQVEAMSLGDRVGVLDGGRLLQIDQPATLYDHPRHQLVAEIIGSPLINFLPVAVVTTETGRHLAGSGFTLCMGEHLPAGLPPHDLVLAIRPEAIRLGRTPMGPSAIPSQVRWVEFHGSRMVVTMHIGTALVRAVVEPDALIKPGDHVFVELGPGHLLDPRSRQFLH